MTVLLETDNEVVLDRLRTTVRRETFVADRGDDAYRSTAFVLEVRRRSHHVAFRFEAERDDDEFVLVLRSASLVDSDEPVAEALHRPYVDLKTGEVVDLKRATDADRVVGRTLRVIDWDDAVDWDVYR